MLGHAEYALLHDYQRLVRVYRPAPPGFRDSKEFNSALASEVLRLHDREQRPLDQSLRGGTQTDRSLPRDNPVFAAFFAMIDAPIRDYVAQLQEAVAIRPIGVRRRTIDWRAHGRCVYAPAASTSIMCTQWDG